MLIKLLIIDVIIFIIAILIDKAWKKEESYKELKRKNYNDLKNNYTKLMATIGLTVVIFPVLLILIVIFWQDISILEYSNMLISAENSTCYYNYNIFPGRIQYPIRDIYFISESDIIATLNRRKKMHGNAIATLFYALYGNYYDSLLISIDIIMLEQKLEKGDLFAIIKNKVLTKKKNSV